MAISTLIKETVLAFLKRKGCLYEGKTNHIILLRTLIQLTSARALCHLVMLHSNLMEDFAFHQFFAIPASEPSLILFRGNMLPQGSQ
jgi:hypothetical protein